MITNLLNAMVLTVFLSSVGYGNVIESVSQETYLVLNHHCLTTMSREAEGNELLTVVIKNMPVYAANALENYFFESAVAFFIGTIAITRVVTGRFYL